MVIEKKLSSDPLVDLMEGCDRWEIKLEGHGLCALVDLMPRLVPLNRKADAAVVQAARTSTGKGLKGPKEDRGLLRYLYSHGHTSPFEMVNVKFHQVLPIFVARQLVRHRTASLNEYSLRYSEAKDRFWIPGKEQLRTQGVSNKQVTTEAVGLDGAAEFIRDLEMMSETGMQLYEKALKGGIGREQARTILPINLYTEWYWEIDLKNLLGFLGLRQDKHAQVEIRVFADAMYDLVCTLVPDAIEAYDDYHPNRGGMLLSRMDIEALKGGPDAGFDALFPSDRELAEFVDKAARLHAVGASERARAALALRKKVATT